MIPSAVAREARENLLDYLQTTYGLTDPDFEAALFEYLSGPEGLFRGPYLDVRLPFRQAKKGAVLPLDIAPPFLPYRHQMRAFERLHGQRGHQPQHTLVTTGTGSGKTECFLYPILDHCWRQREKGKQGIKAILLYPMNALATDQARRIAEILWTDPRLKGKVTAGLYVGGKGSHQVANGQHLIDDRKTLRQAPPDILLTNYKMLDFLLLRPEDQVLWKNNEPETLKFLVLDELHTYDGAQGSDVACLIRRLKARLDTPDGGLCCVGTSATIGEGDEGGKERLVEFARDIFDEGILSDSVITEDRLGIEEALGTNRNLDLHPGSGEIQDLEPKDRKPEPWLVRQKEIWLGPHCGHLTPQEVGVQLERHDFLHQLLRTLGGNPLESGELIQKLSIREDWFAQMSIDNQRLVLDSFVALVSFAKRFSDPMSNGKQREEPFLTIQIQLWLREVRHLLRAVESEPRFQWRSELGGRLAAGGDGSRYLPMVRCRDCGCAGLASVQREGEHRLRDDSEKREIGRAWMTRDPDSRFIVFGHGGVRDDLLKEDFLCPRCLGLSPTQDCQCEGTSTPKGLAVRVICQQTQSSRPKFRPICPGCGAEDSLIFLASRASSLLSVAVSHVYQTEFNEDRKLLAFVDAVQDASHRAGFFGARTYRFNLRALIQEMLQELGGRLPLNGIGSRLLNHTANRLGDLKAAIPVLMPEDLRGHPDYERFLEVGGGGEHQELCAWLVTRLSLEVAFEYGHSVRSGRSLERTGCSTVEIAPDRLERAASDFIEIVNEEEFLESLAEPIGLEQAQHFFTGFLNRLRLRGGVHQDLLRRFVEESGNRFFLSRRMNPLGPVFGPDSVLPRFLMHSPLATGNRSNFDAFASRQDRLNWYRDWASKSLGISSDDDGITQLYSTALERLAEARVLGQVEASDHRSVWGLDPECLDIVDGLRELCCPICRETVRQPEGGAKLWSGRPCPQYRCEGKLEAPTTAPETFYTRIFRAGRVARVFPEEHTGLLSREKRERVEEQFKNGGSPNAPNLLVCTPTLEMGIDIGDLSAVLLCSVPPTTSNYLQRIGRAGRSTGNALCLTMANSRPHDLFFHADPLAMMAGAVDPPGCFLDAPEMLKRQVVSHAMDAWARQETVVTEIPSQTTAVLAEGSKFPSRFIEFYQAQKQTLLDDFLGRFGADTLSELSREDLQTFALSGQVSERVNSAFDEVRRERTRLKRLQQNSLKRVEDLKENPDLAEDNPEIEIAEAAANHKMLGRLITELGRRYPLNVLTDAGVLPNYAFPEPGVELQSVIQVDDKDKRRYDAYQYQRPASAAIRELAPYNSFYAEGRRVQVDEIDLGTTAEPLIENWRLCAACSYMERDELGAMPASSCPSCGDQKWGDVDQRRKMVYFRRSRSLATRLESASADEGEERKRAIYQTHDLICVGADNFGGARLMEDLPFGFEMLTRLKLRELNFGLDEDSHFEVAGHDVNFKGFEVCRDCGRVRPEDAREPVKHAPTCRSKRGKEVRIESVYLYREVESEAIRLLLPMAELDLDIQQASFRAALELGMRRRFGGRAPHLRIKAMREPIRGGGNRHFLVIFDTVPGGTGFLADLWRNDALLDVLSDTLGALKACSCLAQGKDGCYRCLFAYQNQRDMEQTSSEVARRMLGEILEHKVALEDVDTLSNVVLDSKLESELEDRFIRAFMARAKQLGPAKKILREGQERWEVDIKGNRWEIRPQVQLGPSEGVSVMCKPDFLICPLSQGVDPRPIAVFCDGFAYHVQPELSQSRLGDDVKKRRSIIESGRYLVWSVTWDDVGNFEAGDFRKGPSLFDGGHTKPGQAVIQRWGLTPDVRRPETSNMELLWAWLENPDEERWLRELAAIGADFVVDLKTIETATIGETERELEGALGPVGPDPEPVSMNTDTTFLGMLASKFGVKLLGRISMLGARGLEPRLPSWTLRLYDDHERRQDSQFGESWRAFLQAVNLLQFSPGFVFLSTEDLVEREATGADLYVFPRADDGYSLVAEVPVVPSQKEEDPLINLDLLEDELLVAKAVLASSELLPEVGFELGAAIGRVGAEAQLAWPKVKVALLVDGDPDDVAAFRKDDWVVFTSAESPNEIADLVSKLASLEKE